MKTGRVCKETISWLLGVDRKKKKVPRDHCSESLGKPRNAEQ